MRAVGGLIYTIIQLNSPLHHRNSTQSHFIRFPAFVHPPPTHCRISYILPRKRNPKSDEHHWSQKRDHAIPRKTNHIQTNPIYILLHGHTITLNFHVLFLHQPIEIKWWLFQHPQIHLLSMQYMCSTDLLFSQEIIIQIDTWNLQYPLFYCITPITPINYWSKYRVQYTWPLVLHVG